MDYSNEELFDLSTVILDDHGKFADETMVEFDDILTFVGSSGRFQKSILYGSLSPIMFTLALISYDTVFTLFVPEHFCSSGVNMTSSELKIWKEKYIPMESGIDGIAKFSSCQMYNFTSVEGNVRDNTNWTTMTCQYGWTYDKTDFENTIPTDYNWVCEKNYYSTSVFTVSAIGVLVGNIIFGPMADKFGRKPILFISLLVYMVFAMASFFVPHLYGLFLGATFIYSTGFPMIYSIPQLLMAELCDNSM